MIIIDKKFFQKAIVVLAKTFQGDIHIQLHNDKLVFTKESFTLEMKVSNTDNEIWRFYANLKELKQLVDKYKTKQNKFDNVAYFALKGYSLYYTNNATQLVFNINVCNI